MLTIHIKSKNGKNLDFSLDNYNAKIIWKVILILCIGFAFLIGCGNSNPNLDDPEVREKILSKAMNKDDLQTRRAPTDELLIYAPNQENHIQVGLREHLQNYQMLKYLLGGQFKFSNHD